MTVVAYRFFPVETGSFRIIRSLDTVLTLVSSLNSYLLYQFRLKLITDNYIILHIHQFLPYLAHQNTNEDGPLIHVDIAVIQTDRSIAM